MRRRYHVPFRPTATVCVLAIVSVLLIPATWVGAHEDITLVQDADGRLLTGISEVHGVDPHYEFPVRVYEGAFSTAFRSNDPGFVAPESPDGLAAGLALLPADTAVRFDVRAFHLADGGWTNLAYWDGQGEVAFQPVADGYSLSFSTVEPGTAVADGSGVDVAGYPFAYTDADGGIHEHMVFDLANSTGGVAEGIYLWSLNLSMPGLEDSEPVFILHETTAAPLVLDEAVAWTNANLQSLSVPEPSTMLLALTGLIGLLILRRRRA